jgi:hypothetical protein
LRQAIPPEEINIAEYQLDNQMEKIQWMGSIHTSNNQIPRVEQNEK